MSRSAATAQGEPRLQAPGKGLPFWQALLVRYWLFPRFCKAHGWEDASKRFEKEGKRILDLTAGLSPELLTRKVLVSGIPGIEDSSRYWSVSMTIEHLMIVGKGMLSGIIELSHGRKPDYKVDVGAVKPKGGQEANAVIEEFRAFLPAYLNGIQSKLGDRSSRVTLHHPWFGEMTAHQWHCLAALHQMTHRKQIDAIRRGLN